MTQTKRELFWVKPTCGRCANFKLVQQSLDNQHGLGICLVNEGWDCGTGVRIEHTTQDCRCWHSDWFYVAKNKEVIQ